MHYVIDKSTREIVWINPADNKIVRIDGKPTREPLSSAADVWSGFDAELHEFFKCAGQITDADGAPLVEGAALPDYYNFSEDEIPTATIKSREELVLGGHIQAPPGKKYVGDALIDKTRDEKIADGELTVEDVRNEKIAAVNSLYISLIGRGCTYNGVIYSCSKQSRDWLLGQLAVPKDAGWSLAWDSKDKLDEITLDESNLSAFIKHLADHFRTISQIREEKIKFIRRSGTIAELDATDWTGGWALPSTLPAE